jgi:hypothetical protein
VQGKRKRPVLTTFDRVFWITLRRWWSGWRRPWFSVQADTVARWQRERVRRFWARDRNVLAVGEVGALQPSRFAGGLSGWLLPIPCGVRRAFTLN